MAGLKNKHGLTEKQEAFAVATLEHPTLSAAYRSVYNSKAMKSGTIHSEASKLVSHPMVAARIERLTAEKERNQRTEGARLREFIRERLVREATEADSDAARVRAVELLGKLAGVQAFDSERIEQTVISTAADAELELEEALGNALNDPKVRQLFEKVG